jgi:hypothetical protein
MTDSNNRLLSTLIALQLSVLGILIVMLFNPPAPGDSATRVNPPENSLAQAEPPSPTVYSQSVSPELKSALREIIREELAALPLPTAAGNDAASRPEIVLSDSELQEQQTAAAISTSVVQQATSAGVWTRADTEALLPYITKMSDTQRLALVDQLYGAINRQEMEIQDFPPL